MVRRSVVDNRYLLHSERFFIATGVSVSSIMNRIYLLLFILLVLLLDFSNFEVIGVGSMGGDVIIASHKFVQLCSSYDSVVVIMTIYAVFSIYTHTFEYTLKYFYRVARLAEVVRSDHYALCFNIYIYVYPVCVNCLYNLKLVIRIIVVFGVSVSIVYYCLYVFVYRCDVYVLSYFITTHLGRDLYSGASNTYGYISMQWASYFTELFGFSLYNMSDLSTISDIVGFHSFLHLMTDMGCMFMVLGVYICIYGKITLGAVVLSLVTYVGATMYGPNKSAFIILGHIYLYHSRILWFVVATVALSAILSHWASHWCYFCVYEWISINNYFYSMFSGYMFCISAFCSEAIEVWKCIMCSYTSIFGQAVSNGYVYWTCDGSRHQLAWSSLRSTMCKEAVDISSANIYIDMYESSSIYYCMFDCARLGIGVYLWDIYYGVSVLKLLPKLKLWAFLLNSDIAYVWYSGLYNSSVRAVGPSYDDESLIAGYVDNLYKLYYTPFGHSVNRVDHVVKNMHIPFYSKWNMGLGHGYNYYYLYSYSIFSFLYIGNYAHAKLRF